MSIYDKSSLVLIPSGTKTGKVYSQKPVSGDGDFTFTRSSAATRVNADGFIEKERSNELLYTEDWENAAWVKSSGVVVDNNAAIAPDGTNTAIEIDLVTTNKLIGQTPSLSGVYGSSVYIKGTSGETLSWNVGGVGVTITLDGTWQLFERAPQTVSANAWNISNFNSTTATLFYVWHPQLNQGTIPFDYIKNEGTKVYEGITDNVPRLDYTDSSCPALLLEPQRTNLVTQSEYFSDWFNFRNTLTANSSVSPEGISNAYAMIPETSNDTHFIYFNLTESAVAYSYSLFAKSNGLQWIQLAKGGGGYANFDLVNGVTGNYGVDITDSDIEDYGNGWYKITAYYTSVGGASNVAISALSSNVTSRYQAFAGNGTDGYYLYGAQLEAGSYATSYIPTYGSSVTRVGDAASVTGVSNLINSTEGTIYYEAKSISSSVTNYSYMIALSDGTNNNRIEIRQSNGEVQFLWRVAGVYQGNIITNGITITDRWKFALSYSSNAIKMYFNGSLIGSIASPTLYPSNTLYRIGYDSGTPAYPFQGNNYKTMIFPTALTDQEAIDLTTI